MKSTKIHIIKENEVSFNSWSAFNCLYAEIENRGESYILRNGEWYLVNTNFLASINKELQNIFPYEFQLPQFNHEREEHYNSFLAKGTDGCFLLDKKLINHGGGNSKFEFADIIKNGSDLIHVKYYRSSSCLSHLFSQAYVSLELFISDTEFRRKLNKILPDTSKLVDVTTRPDTQAYKVVYAIAINKDIPNNLPLFSKITLKNTTKSLRNLGFSVYLAQVKIDPDLERLKKMRASKKRL